MPDYKKMYLSLFNGVSDAIERLKQLQINAEEMYISDGEAETNAVSDPDKHETAAG